MRKVKKSKVIPEVLAKAQQPNVFGPFESKIYAHKSVKEQLRKDQFGKCIYCECFLNGYPGDVEHFRPKKGYTIPGDRKFYSPGYHWLAYNWDNLFLSCTICNRSHKKNHFPLEKEAGRDIKSKNIKREVPLLINPCEVDPSIHIGFNRYIAYARIVNVKKSSFGSLTIETLQLNSRPVLVENRRRVWARWEQNLKLVEIARALIGRGEVECGVKLLIHAKECLAYMKSETEEYSAMFHNYRI